MSIRIESLVLPLPKLVVVFSVIATLPILGQTLGESPPSLNVGQNSAKKGDIFEGEVVRKAGNEVWLDTTPCRPEAEKRTVAFVKPFKMRTLKKETCDSHKSITIVSVEKR